MLSSVKKSAGHCARNHCVRHGKRDETGRATGDEIQKAAKQTITVAEQTEEFVADNAIMDVGCISTRNVRSFHRRRTRRNRHSQHGGVTFRR